MRGLDVFFDPRSIAVIGATPTPGKVGNIVIENLYGEGYPGKIFLVNPNHKELLGMPCYRSVQDCPGDVDLAVVVVPAKLVPGVVDEAGRKGVKAAVVISAGFSEGDEEGKARERELLEVAARHGMRFVGPNSLGVIAPHSRMNASFARTTPLKGPIAFFSQSGAFCTAAIEYSVREMLGFSAFVSSGNKADVDDADLVRHFASDERTRCIAAYMESTRDGQAFFDALAEASLKKPIVILKAGRTERGARAAKSHTGALAGSDSAYEGVFRQTGVYRAKTMYELFDAAQALAYQPPMDGEGVAIVTNAGGMGVIATDFANDLGLGLAELSPETLEEIRKACPPTWNPGNPVDIIGDADTARYANVLTAVGRAPEVKAIMVIAARQAATNLFQIAKWIAITARISGKPTVACFAGIFDQESEQFLDSRGIPVMSVPERAITALHALSERGKWLKKKGVRIPRREPNGEMEGLPDQV
ncbi:MAG: CoA-binding protein [Thermoplasmata archaeon]|jgi:acetyltransferase|nr:CoA-binding protein [Thermoplasmata archaeon]